MFCKNCGQKLSDNSKFCEVCGTKIESQPQQQSNLKGSAAQSNRQNATQNIWSAQPMDHGAGQNGYAQQTSGYQQNAYSQNMYTQPQPMPTPAMPMKWYKFLIYFAIIAGGIINIMSGILYITGMIWDMTDADVYSVFPDLQGIDVFVGILFIAIGIYAFPVRSALAKFKKNGPSMLYILYAVNFIVPLIYNIAVTSVTGIDVVSDGMASICVSIAMMVCNIGYFNKRRNMFIY